MQNLSDCCSIFQIEDFIGQYQLSAVVLSLLKSFYQFFSLLIMIRYDDLHRLVVFDVDVVLVCRCTILEMLRERIVV